MNFACSKLQGYSRATSLQSEFSIHELCTSSVISQLPIFKNLGFAPAEYSKEPFWDVFHKNRDEEHDGSRHVYTVNKGGEYDYSSIMHYSSEAWSSNGASDNPEESTVHNVPLVRWKAGGRGYEPPGEVTERNAELIPFNTMPSEGDVEGVKALYPWLG